jgi:hypothetical protein
MPIRMALTILILLMVCVGIILLQVFFSTRKGKWFGLVLPAISFLISLILVISIIAYTNIGITSTSRSEDGVIVSHEIKDTRSDFGVVVNQVIVTFLLTNIPTVIFIVIYIACREKRKQQLEIEKMHIQDIV